MPSSEVDVHVLMRVKATGYTVAFHLRSEGRLGRGSREAVAYLTTDGSDESTTACSAAPA